MDMLEDIFNSQRELMKKYHPIEMSLGIRHTAECPLDLTTRRGQATARDFCWRITEEITEAVECARDKDTCKHPEVIEELSDALHFLVELAILSNIAPKDIFPGSNEDLLVQGLKQCIWTEGFEQTAYETIHQLGVAANLLKGRAWKLQFDPPNEKQFQIKVIRAFGCLFFMFVEAKCSVKDVHEAYHNKHSINVERAEGGY